jgi:hypothetical protein
VEPSDGLFYDEPDGWTTAQPQSSVPTTDMICPQPHLFGNNGYTAASCNVRDQTNDRNISVWFCRTTGGDTSPDSEMCDGVTTTGTSTSVTGMVFPSTTDSVRSRYYWYIRLPGDDTNGGSVGDGQSYFVGHFFEDN